MADSVFRSEKIQKYKDEERELRKIKQRLKKPVKRTPEEIEKALSIVGIGEGPEDMAEKYRYYLYEER